MRKDIQILYTYLTAFKRRKGWRLLPRCETRFRMSDPYECRSMSVGVSGDPEDLDELESCYRFTLRSGAQDFFIEPYFRPRPGMHSRALMLTLSPSLVIPQKHHVVISMTGKPFKTRARVDVMIALHGVKIKHVELTPTDNSESPDSKESEKAEN